MVIVELRDHRGLMSTSNGNSIIKKEGAGSKLVAEDERPSSPLVSRVVLKPIPDSMIPTLHQHAARFAPFAALKTDQILDLEAEVVVRALFAFAYWVCELTCSFTEQDLHSFLGTRPGRLLKE